MKSIKDFIGGGRKTLIKSAFTGLITGILGAILGGSAVMIASADEPQNIISQGRIALSDDIIFDARDLEVLAQAYEEGKEATRLATIEEVKASPESYGVSTSPAGGTCVAIAASNMPRVSYRVPDTPAKAYICIVSYESYSDNYSVSLSGTPIVQARGGFSSNSKTVAQFMSIVTNPQPGQTIIAYGNQSDEWGYASISAIN